jgi:hypothetical protein
MALADDGSLDLSVPLSDVSPSSFFAVHYHFIKAMPCGPASDTKPSTFGTGLFTTNFLAYYGLSPVLQRAYLIGLIPAKAESHSFWLTNQDPVEHELPVQFRQHECEVLDAFRLSTKAVEKFVESDAAAHMDVSHYDFEHMAPVV